MLVLEIPQKSYISMIQNHYIITPFSHDQYKKYWSFLKSYNCNTNLLTKSEGTYSGSKKNQYSSYASGSKSIKNLSPIETLSPLCRGTRLDKRIRITFTIYLLGVTISQ